VPIRRHPEHEGGDFGTPTQPQFLICPHKGLDYLQNVVWGPILRRVAANGLHLDHLIAWPYDWGGCGCEHDWPWGSVVRAKHKRCLCPRATPFPYEGLMFCQDRLGTNTR
jgi:hypothetical protein